MKIAIITHQFPSLEHPYIFEWIREMILRGIDLWIIAEEVTEPPSSGFWKSGEAVSKRILRMNLIGQPDLLLFFQSVVRALFHPGKSIGLLKTLFNLENGNLKTAFRKSFEYLPLINKEFDLIHFNAPQIAIRRFELTSFFQSKSLISFRGQDFSFYPERYVPLLSKADHLHFISQHIFQLAVDNGYSGDKHTIIPPMVDHQFYRPCGEQIIKPAPPYVLFTAARLEWMKGFEFALQAVALLVEKGWDLEYYIAGDGDFKEAIIYTIHQLGIQDRVHLLGWLSPEGIRGWMQKANIYVLASVEEAFNNSVLQAQACGLPVVCSDEGGLPENIENSVTGLLFRSRDAWDMANKIEKMINNLSDEYFLHLGPERVRRKFDIEKISLDFVDLYKEILNSDGY